MIDETQVVNRLLAGDSSAADKIVNRYEAMVYQYCLHFLGSEREAEEASARAFVRLFAQMSADTAEKPLKEMIMKIAVKVCFDWQKHYKTPKKGEADLTLEEQLHQALQRLVRQQRAILLLRDMSGMSKKAIAGIVDIKESQVSMRIARARNNLCDFLLQSGAELGVKGGIIERKSKESQNYHELCSRYVDGNVSEEEKKDLLDHIQTCESCAAYLQALTSVGRELSHMGEGKMPESLKETILDAVRLQAEKTSQGHRKRSYAPTVTLILIAVLFSAIVCSGWMGGAFSNSSNAYEDHLVQGSVHADSVQRMQDFSSVTVPESVSSSSYSFAIAAVGGNTMPDLSTEALLVAMDEDNNAYYTIDGDVASAERLCKNLESFGYKISAIDSSQIAITGSASSALIVIMGGAA